MVINQNVRIAKDCALINVERIKPFTEKYDMIVEFLKSDSVEEASAVLSAAYDAINAAYAVDNTRVSHIICVISYVAKGDYTCAIEGARAVSNKSKKKVAEILMAASK